MSCSAGASLSGLYVVSPQVSSVGSIVMLMISGGPLRYRSGAWGRCQRLRCINCRRRNARRFAEPCRMRSPATAWSGRCAIPASSCKQKYGLSKDTIEYLLHDELPSALPEELLSASQKHRLRRDFHEANSIPDSAQKERAVAAVFTRYQGLYGVSEATLQAVVGPECDRVGSTERPPGEPPSARSAPSLPEPGQVVEVRGSTWAVANVQAQGLPLSPADDATAQLNHVVDLQSLDEDRLGEQLSVIWELGGRPDRHPGAGAAGAHQPARLRRPGHAGGFHRRHALGSGHLGRPEPLPGALLVRRRGRGLSARTAAPRPGQPAGQPAAGRRRRPGQDHRSRPGAAGALPAAPGPHRGDRVPAEPGAEVARRDARQVRSAVRHRQQRADGPGAPHPRAARQPVPALSAGDREHGVAAAGARAAAAAGCVRASPQPETRASDSPSTC